MLRSTFTQCESPVYAVVWAADCDQLCYCSGSNVIIKSIQSSTKQTAWKAHEGVVLKVDWSPINHTIVTGGEDCKYKVCVLPVARAVCWGAQGGSSCVWGGVGIGRGGGGPRGHLRRLDVGISVYPPPVRLTGVGQLRAPAIPERSPGLRHHRCLMVPRG